MIKKLALCGGEKLFDHTQMPDELFHWPIITEEDEQKAKEMVQQYMDFDEILITHAGSTISSHCGPKTLGVLFIRK